MKNGGQSTLSLSTVGYSRPLIPAAGDIVVGIDTITAQIGVATGCLSCDQLAAGGLAEEIGGGGAIYLTTKALG